MKADRMIADLTIDDKIGRIIVALDYSNAEQALKLVQELRGIPCYLKVGLQLFYAAGPEFIISLKKQGYKVFLDLKLHDIPNTVKGGANSIARLGVDMFNVHAAGGIQMMKAAMEGAAEAKAALQGSDLFESPDQAEESKQGPIVIAVTHLTSTSQEMLNKEIGIPSSIEQAVLQYAKNAKSAGLHGVVASPLEVPLIKQKCGIDLITVTPGIRPIGADVGDQSRVMTPKEAFAQGTDYIVIGRPITAAPKPREALEKIIEELS